MALKREDLKDVRQRRYLGKDFDSLRAELLEYARLYYPDKIKDFSESSLGGLLLDFAAYTGDTLSFYLDHQYSELNYDTAVEVPNIERALKTAGVPITGAAPSLVPCTFYVQVPAENVSNTIGPANSCIPVIQAGSVMESDNGIEYVLLEDVDFNKKKSDGTRFAQVKVGEKTNDNTPATFIMAHHGLCISGKEATETVSISSDFVPFRRVTISNSNVSEITSVVDDYGNIYYEVGALSHDVVYKNVLNTAKDNSLVKDAMKVIPAPYRFITETDLTSRKTTLIFGGGNASTLEDDIIPDPSDFAIAFPYSRTFSRIPVNPQKLLQTKTLGVAAVDTSLRINYRYGGGLQHNVPKNNIRTIKTLKMFFPGNPASAIAANIRGNTEVNNLIEASGGEDAPTIDELKTLIPSIRNSQERIVTRPDLLSRVYTLPSNFGRAFRAAIRSNPNNPLATQLYIISRDPDSKLIISPDTLKQNIRTYLNPYRMISDAIDVLDARVINLSFTFDVLIDPALNKSVVLQNVLIKLRTLFDIKNFHIDQPIVTSDVVNTIFTVPGIISINKVVFNNNVGTVNNKEYSQESFDVSSNTRQGIIFPPPGAIFEIRYPEFDLIGRASS